MTVIFMLSIAKIGLFQDVFNRKFSKH